MPDAHELFEWLRNLAFVESGPLGLFPHDVAREALVADLHWRNPDWYAELHQRARDYYAVRLKQTVGREQQRVLFDYVFLHRDNPTIRPFLEWRETGAATPEYMREYDKPALEATVAKHEKSESARLAAYWFERQPEGVVVYRDTERKPAGLIAKVALRETDAGDREKNPAAGAAWRYLERHAPLRPGEGATLFRFWMACDTYQAVSATQSLLFANAVQHYLATPNLAFTFFPVADPDFWAPAFAYFDLTRLPEADFEVGGRRYGMYGHDWRVVSPAAWLDLLAHRENPARSVAERAGPGADEAGKIAALRELLQEAAEALQASPREEKLYHALHRTYLRPALTQERAAELLNLPFSTYRRHLKGGVTRVTEILWQKEIGGH